MAAVEEHLRQWEELLTAIVNPESGSSKKLLSHLLQRAGIEERDFWKLSAARRSRSFLSAYSRVSRSLPALELSAFDLDRVSKERFRTEPLTLGAAWHYGFWRSYFSHAAITHPANDGLREEFSTAWDILRRQPAILWSEPGGKRLDPQVSFSLDMPILVGPFPHSDGKTMERAYLEAIRSSDPERDLKIRTRVIIDQETYRLHEDFYVQHLDSLWLRIPMAQLQPNGVTRNTGGWKLLQEVAAKTLIAEVSVSPLVDPLELREVLQRVGDQHPQLLVSVHVSYGDAFWDQVFVSAMEENVAVLHVDAGSEKSYRLIPAVDSFLKKARLRSKVQLVTSGGATDTISSASVVYEAVLLGANAGSVTHLAELALSPDFSEAQNGVEAQQVVQSLAATPSEQLRELAMSTLTCWQHSILDFLSCMGIDDIQKTSGNDMAITMTEDWVREVDAIATRPYGLENKKVNERRLRHEAIPARLRKRFRVSNLLGEVQSDLSLVAAAKTLAHRNANYHLMNTNQSLSADHLEIIYKMSAGRFPEVEDFFPDGPLGPLSIDGVQVKVSRQSVAAALNALRQDSKALDYINLCVPRGFDRSGAVEPNAQCVLSLDRDGGRVLKKFESNEKGGFEVDLTDVPKGNVFVVVNRRCISLEPAENAVPSRRGLRPAAGQPAGVSVRRASADRRILLKELPSGRAVLWGEGIREPLYSGPVNHASISLGAAGEDFLLARVEGNAGLSLTSSGEGGPLRLPPEIMRWESLQAASGHFGITAADLRLVRDVEIKINQGAKPGKGGRLAGPKVTPTVSKARNIPVGTDALSPDPKHDIYSIEDMPAEVWLWHQFENYVGIKITGSTYTKFVAAGMWSNFVVDYLLVDAGMGGSGNYHADSSRVGWPDIFRTILHTHHALLNEPLGGGSIRDLNGAAFGAGGGTKLVASGGIRSEMDMLKILIAGADGLLEASIGKAVAFGCNQCGNCHLDCPRGGITTKVELTVQNDRATMAKRFRNWTALNMVKMAVLLDAINRDLGYVNAPGKVVNETDVFDDIRKVRGRTDLLVMPEHPEPRPAIPIPEVTKLRQLYDLQTQMVETAQPEREPEPEHDSCRVGSLSVSDPVDVQAIWEAARLSSNGGNNRGGGIGWAGFAPKELRDKTCMIFNTIGPDRQETMQKILDHLEGLILYDATGKEMDAQEVKLRLREFLIPVRQEFQGEEGWRRAGLLESVGDYTMLFTELRGDTLWRYARKLLDGERWMQRRIKYGHRSDKDLMDAIDRAVRRDNPFVDAKEVPELLAFVRDVKEEYFMTLAHIIDTRYYRTGGPQPKFAARRSGYVVSMGQDMGSIKISGWTHLIPTYFDFDAFWANYPGAREAGGVHHKIRGEETWTQALMAHVWGMHHRYPTNSPAIDSEGRGNPAGAHPFKAYNVLLMHNGEQVGVDSTAPLLTEQGYVYVDASMGSGAEEYEGDSLYERKALTDTEYAAYLVDYTRRVLGLDTDDATQIISPITGIDLEAVEPAERRERYRSLGKNYVYLTPTGPYKFTIIEARPQQGSLRVGFRENMDIKFLRPHEIAINWDSSPSGVRAIANGSEAKIADAMLGVLRQQNVLADAGSDLRFNMRPGGRPGCDEMGGVFESFIDLDSRQMTLENRFGEELRVDRAGSKPDPLRGLVSAVSGAKKHVVEESRERLRQLEDEGGDDASREAFVRWSLERVRDWSFDEYRTLVEHLMPRYARQSPQHMRGALQILTEFRKRLQFADTGGKSLAAMNYYTDGGFEYDGEAEGGLYRLLSSVPNIWETKAAQPLSQIAFDTRHDLVGPSQPEAQSLVVDMHGFKSEAFGIEEAGKFLSEAVKAGWRHIVTYNYRGGPRYLGCNTVDAEGVSARGVRIDFYGPQVGDFLGALLEGAQLYCYGQAQSHVGMKADSGYIFVLQDILNTGFYSAHGGTLSVWDSGSRFAVAGQNRVYLEDGVTLAEGLRSIHFGSPNEYAFEYLMSGGENSLHVILGLEKPNGKGQLRLRNRPYAGKFFMSGAAAGRVVVFDPNKKMEAAQVHGNMAQALEAEEWQKEVAPFLDREAKLRGVPIEVQDAGMRILIEGTWRQYACNEAFTKYVPIRLPKRVQRQGVAPPALVNMVPE